MTLARAACACLLGLLSVGAAGQPYALVVQESLSPQPEAELDLPIATYLAAELERDGRVVPVVWSMSDPVFRQWAADGLAPSRPVGGDPREAQGLARKLKVPYVIALQAVRLGPRLRLRIEVNEGGRTTWHQGDRVTRQDVERALAAEGDAPPLGPAGEMIVYVDGRPDWDATARAIAHSWAKLLAEGPLRRESARPRSPDGTTGSEALAPPSDVPEVSDPAQEAESALAAGRPARAVLLLREAVDRDPRNGALRTRLAQALALAGFNDEAVEEARRAARAGATGPEPWLLAAQAALDGGDGESARRDLNEALARGATPGQTTPLRVQAHLLNGQIDEALALLDEGPADATPYPRALALALAGRGDALAETLPPGTALDERSYVLLVRCLDRALLRWLDDLRSVPPAVRLNPGRPETVALAETTRARFESLSTLVDRTVAPSRYEASHEGRRLAHVMLLQSALDAVEFARTTDPGSAEESAVSLGQALQLLQQARERYRSEQTDDAPR